MIQFYKEKEKYHQKKRKIKKKGNKKNQRILVKVK